MDARSRFLGADPPLPEYSKTKARVLAEGERTPCANAPIFFSGQGQAQFFELASSRVSLETLVCSNFSDNSNVAVEGCLLGLVAIY